MAHTTELVRVVCPGRKRLVHLRRPSVTSRTLCGANPKGWPEGDEGPGCQLCGKVAARLDDWDNELEDQFLHFYGDKRP